MEVGGCGLTDPQRRVVDRGAFELGRPWKSADEIKSYKFYLTVIGQLSFGIRTHNGGTITELPQPCKKKHFLQFYKPSMRFEIMSK